MDQTTDGRRAQRRSQRQALSRNQLLDAAEEVFGRRGFYEATLKDVAELAEFSVGSVYSFFDNKEDLYRSVFLRRGEEYLPAMKEAASDGADAREQLGNLVRFEVEFFRRHPAFGRLYLRAARGAALPAWESPVDDILVANFHRAMGIQAEIFRRGQRDGTLRRGEPEVLARLLSGIIGAFHGVDPVLLGEDAPAGPGFDLEDLYQIVDRAFGA